MIAGNPDLWFRHGAVAPSVMGEAGGGPNLRWAEQLLKGASIVSNPPGCRIRPATGRVAFATWRCCNVAFAVQADRGQQTWYTRAGDWPCRRVGSRPV